MRRLFLIVVLLGLVLLAVFVVVLGAFPPEPRQQEIQKVLPNDHFDKKAG
jgi:Mn2+/Fe2+ NRAMP family transporter